VPRYAFGDALRGLIRWGWTAVTGGPASTRTAAELPSWHLAGRLYGRYLQRDDPRRDPGAGLDPASTAQYGDGSSLVEPSGR
jgi:hypothetical protein